MADKTALIVHLAGTGEPILIALDPEAAKDLAGRLRRLLETAGTQVITALDGTEIVINFAHVATAHVGQAPPMAVPYGLPKGGASA